jgi:hypothetical protein
MKPKERNFNMTRLPLYAFTTSSVTGETMMIIRGERGLHWDKNLANFTAEEMNSFHRVTPEQLKAMEIGAFFGWKVPGANPDYHRKEAASA